MVAIKVMSTHADDLARSLMSNAVLREVKPGRVPSLRSKRSSSR